MRHRYIGVTRHASYRPGLAGSRCRQGLGASLDLAPCLVSFFFMSRFLPPHKQLLVGTNRLPL